MGVWRLRRGYLLAGGAAVVGLLLWLASWPVGAADGGVAGRAGAAPVVTPAPVLARGVTSRMPGGAAGGDEGAAFCAVFCGGVAGVAGLAFWTVGEVPACSTEELFRP